MKEICGVLVLCFCLALSDPIPETVHAADLAFEWTSPLTLSITNKKTDQQDEMELRPAQGIGGVEVECLFDGFLKKDTNGSGSVLGCYNWPTVDVVIVANISQGTMFTFYSDKKTTIELLEIIDSEEEEKIDRVKRSSYTPEDYVEYDEGVFAFSGSGVPTLPSNLYYQYMASYDEGFLRNFNGDKMAAEKYIVKVITFSRPFFKKASLTSNVHFLVNDEIKFLEGKEFQIDPNLVSADNLTIADAYKIDTSEPLIIFAFSDDSEQWRGVARMRSACDASLARAVIKWRSAYQRAAKTLAHEKGHLFGKYHDKDEDDLNKRKPDLERTSLELCSEKGIMSDVSIQIPLRPQDKAFSECSRKRFIKWYTNYGKECLKTAVDCDNGAWAPYCSCGLDARSSLCSRQEGGYCERATGTCLVKEDKVKLLENTLETCSAFTHNTLLSGCADPEPLSNGRFLCLEDDMTCHVVCDPGYYLEITDMAGLSALQAQRFMKCLGNTWTPLPTTFKCIPACRGGATLLSTSPGYDMVMCQDKTESTCEKDFESLCPAGWNLCTPGQFNNRNDDWNYNWRVANAGYPLGVIYCRSGVYGGAGHYAIYDMNPVLNTDQRLNCGRPSGRPGCEYNPVYGWDCNDKGMSALCCAPTRTCGDGLVQQEEDCDDGNDSNMDDCLNSCTWKNPGAQ